MAQRQKPECLHPTPPLFCFPLAGNNCFLLYCCAAEQKHILNLLREREREMGGCERVQKERERDGARENKRVFLKN